MQLENISSGQFALEIGIQNSTLSHILNNRNNPSLDVLKKILNRFPKISSDWLILGQGPMFRQESHSQSLSLFGNEDENSYESGSLGLFNDQNYDQSSASKENEMLKKAASTNSPFNLTEKFPENDPAVLNPPPSVKVVEVKIEKTVQKIILYYTDNTFQEFESK
jgi:transcriptional regulator with XRE-family HTH domain